MNTALKVFDLVWPLVAVGGGLTVLTQVMKRAVGLEKNSVIRLLFHSLTVGMVALTWWVDKGMSGYSLLLHGGSYSGFASALYPIVKYSDGKLSKIYNAMKLVKKYEPQLEKIVQDAEQATGVDVGVKAPAEVAATVAAKPAADF